MRAIGEHNILIKRGRYSIPISAPIMNDIHIRFLFSEFIKELPFRNLNTVFCEYHS